MAKRTAALRILFGADTKQFDAALKTSVRKMQRTAKDLQSLGKSLSTSISAPLLGIAAISAKTAAGFEFAMAKVQAVSGFTAAEMERLTKQAQDLGASTSKTQDEVAGLQLELAKLGKSSSEIEAMTEDVLNLSIAFDQDLGETARVIGATLNQFGLDANQAGRVADNMAILFGSSALDLEKFDSAMRVVGPTANAMGLSVEQAGAAMAILVNSGVEASTVGTALTKSLSVLAKEGFTGAEALEAITKGNLTTAQQFEIFGDRAAKIIPILQGAGGALDEYVQKQLEGAGAASKARAILEDTAQGGFDKLKSAASAAATRIGQKLLPTINRIVDGLTGLLSSFAELDAGVIASIVSIAGFAAALGPALFAAGQMVFALSQLKLALGSATAAQIKQNAVLLTNPYVLAGAAIVALGALIYKLATRTDELTESQKRIESASKKAQDSYSNEAAKVRTLSDEYRLMNDDLGTRKKVIEDLKQINPSYFGDLDAEKTSYEDLKNAVDKYVDSLREKAIAKAFDDEALEVATDIVKKEDELRKAKLRQAQAQEAINNGAKEFETITRKIGDDFVLVEQATEAGRELYEANRAVGLLESSLVESNAALEDLQNSAAEARKSMEGVVNPDTGGGEDGGGETTIFETEKPKRMAKAVNSLSQAMDRYNHALSIAGKRQKTMVETVQEMTDAVKNGREPIQGYRTDIAGIGTAVDLTIGQQLSRVFNNLAEIGIDTFHELKENASEFGELIGNRLGQAFQTAAESTMSLRDAMKAAGREIIGVVLAEVVAMAIRNAFEAAGATGPLALVLAPALAGAAAGAAKSLFSSSVPAFAQGGMVTGPTLSLLGDNRSGKEAVIPFERMGEFVRSAIGPNLAGAGSVNVSGRIDGRDLILVQERGARNTSRFR